MEDLNHHFRVVAGPGAGKTHWLVEHIDNVIRNSDRINSISKIACITYTTIAAEEIKSRLNTTGDNIEVSTIHHFLYKNIVKPYSHLIKNETGDYLINIEKLDGHDEHKPSIGKVKSWLENLPGNESKRDKYLIKKILYDDKKLTFKILSDLTWKLDSSGNCMLKFQTPQKFPKKFLDQAENYKRLYWLEGRIHHEDLLYFAYRILDENPIIKQFISARYPYIFLDEFQDTNPIQTHIIKNLAISGSLIGLIGDPAQSIYKFQGASRDDFLNFHLDRQADYKIEGNRRSTKKITFLLNHLRRDDPIKQIGRDEEGRDVCLIVAKNMIDSLSYYKKELDELNSTNNYCILARRNSCVAELKSTVECYSNNLWDEIREIDPKRGEFLQGLFLAQEYAHQQRYNIAIIEIIKLLRSNKDGTLKDPLKCRLHMSDLTKRGIAISILQYLADNRMESVDWSLLEFYQKFNEFILANFNIKLKGVQKGKFKDLSKSISLEELINNLKLVDDLSNVRTIHKSKGAEFDSVLVYLEKEQDLNLIIKPKINSESDDCRLLYVALSRAKNLLYIRVPSITSEAKLKLELLNINIIYLNKIDSKSHGDRSNEVINVKDPQRTLGSFE